MSDADPLERLLTCTHPVADRFAVRAHPSIHSVCWCRGCGAALVLEHGVPEPRWRLPALVELARRGRPRAT